MIQEKLRRNALFLILPLLAALLSFFVLAGVASSSEFHKHSIAALEEKQTTVLELTAASTAASAASMTPVPFRAEISTTWQTSSRDSSPVLIWSPFLRTTSIMLMAMTTGMPSSVSWVVR